jgi:uncharacterized membrane protein
MVIVSFAVVLDNTRAMVMWGGALIAALLASLTMFAGGVGTGSEAAMLACT